MNCEICSEIPNTVTNLDQYGLPIKRLGEGGYGSVQQHKCINTQNDVAIKSAHKHRNELSPDVIREIAALTALSGHPDIIRMIAWKPPNFGQSEGAKIVLECGLGSLSDAMKGNRLNMTDVKNVMYQLFRGCVFMHAKDIWHRDLKSGNIIVTHFNPIKVKIADFGLARAGPFCNMRPTKIMYTLWYRPPEILVRELLTDKELPENESYSVKAETWALGVIFWELLASTVKYTQPNAILALRGATVREQLDKILAMFGWPKNEQKSPLHIDPDILMTRLGVKEHFLGNAKKQMTGLSNRIWDLIDKLFDYDTETRVSAAEALNHPYFEGYDKYEIREKCFTDLQQMQRTSRNENCLSIIPGDDLVEKMANYGDVACLMLNYITETSMKTYVGTFGLAVELFHCALSSGRIAIPNVYKLTTLGYCCVSLAGKYHAKAPSTIEGYVYALGGVYNPIDFAQFEVSVFGAIGANLSVPTAYRMLIDLVGCPTNESSLLHKSVFAWAVVLLYVIKMTILSFKGLCSEQAKLAVALSAHYHAPGDDPTKRLVVIEQLPGCAKENIMSGDVVSSAAKILYWSLNDTGKHLKNLLIKSIRVILKELTHSKYDSLTMDELQGIIRGDVVNNLLMVTTDMDQSEEDSPREPVFGIGSIDMESSTDV